MYCSLPFFQNAFSFLLSSFLFSLVLLRPKISPLPERMGNVTSPLASPGLSRYPPATFAPFKKQTSKNKDSVFLPHLKDVGKLESFAATLVYIVHVKISLHADLEGLALLIDTCRYLAAYFPSPSPLPSPLPPQTVTSPSCSTFP